MAFGAVWNRLLQQAACNAPLVFASEGSWPGQSRKSEARKTDSAPSDERLVPRKKKHKLWRASLQMPWESVMS